MKVGVDADRCRGHGVCLGLCPEVFSLTDDGYAEAVVTEVPGHLEAQVREAVQSCPESAIVIE
ncbi:ferredoxin [Nocardia implantans]|uniref:Ferredoxin n=1 Tax=Nocardia implantans TaxID=3108168 RepID=A0ABU6AV66_9NOCA|nr:MULTISPECIES: ferredoxin [unclassified Nocardia]MBF6192427.1 ferredoxin [Nocardia beijingensis]MEA3527670.1 ferredoxin [Nocardia sp. CDC192]MEB3511378.1 ferredoxin [Nocardia sp. CDC186]